VGNLNGYNDVQNVKNQVIQHAVQNPRIPNVGNQNGLIGVPWNANQNPNENADLDEIEEVNANCILMANLQQASTSGTQIDKALIYDSDGSAEIRNYEDCYDNEIFNMFTQEEQYTELLEPIPEPHQVPQNDNNVVSEVFSVEQSGRTVEQHPANVEETHDLYESLYNNLAIEVEKINTINSGSESRPPMLNKENYVPWSSRLLRYAKSRPNGKLIHKSILNGPYVRRMIPEPGDAERDVNVNETFHEQTDDELSEKELKQIKADDQAIQTILLGFPEEIYAAVDSYETAQEIWLRVQQMMKGYGIGIQEKKANIQAKLLNTNQQQSKNFIKPKEQADCSTGYEYESRQINADDWRNQVAQNPRVQNVGNQNGLIGVQGNGNQNQIGNGIPVAVRAEGNAAEHNGNQIRSEEYDLMAAAADLDEIEEVNANCILMANLQQASSLGTQIDSTPVFDFDRSAEVHEYENCYNNEIFNMFTQEEQYTELLEPIPEPQQVPQNDNNFISEVTDVEQEGETVEQHSVNFEETRALYDSLYQNLAVEVEKFNSVNRKLKETNANLTTELARYKNQERCFEISQEKYDKLERCYQQSVYQEQCLSKKINALHLSSEKKKLKSDFKTREDELLDKQIQLEKKIKELNNILLKTGQSIQTIHMLLTKPDSFYHTEQKMALGISELNKQLSKEKSTVSFLLEEKKKLKSDFKTREDELLDKQIQLEKRIKELNNILLKTGQSIQTIHMLLTKPDSFYHTEQKMALGYQNPFYLKQAQTKQQSLYDGKVLLEKHYPPVVHDSEETLQLAQESRDKMKKMNKEIKPANYTKINHLSGVFVP
nr:hypothetical protein [Tanacetum cinerariifolium]